MQMDSMIVSKTIYKGSSPLHLAIWDSSLRGRSTGLKNQGVEVRYFSVPPYEAVR